MTDYKAVHARFDGLETTVRNTVLRHGLRSPTAVARVTDAELLAWNGMGPQRVAILRRWLAERGWEGYPDAAELVDLQ